jgi:hypothetical protein
MPFLTAYPNPTSFLNPSIQGLFLYGTWHFLELVFICECVIRRPLCGVRSFFLMCYSTENGALCIAINSLEETNDSFRGNEWMLYLNCQNISSLWNFHNFFPLQNYFARNFYNMRMLALFVAFAINFILLFYKVCTSECFNDQTKSTNRLRCMDRLPRSVSEHIQTYSLIHLNERRKLNS